MNINYPGLDDFLLAALKEDIGTGDVTSNCCIDDGAVSSGDFIAKEPGVICGLDIVARVFKLLDESVLITTYADDGCTVSAGGVITGDVVTGGVSADDINAGGISAGGISASGVIAKITGPTKSILSGERTALNLLQHMSGIATATAEAVSAISGTSAKITDTRKTTPGMRTLEKYAVRCGGGSNHRFNLSDGVLIKDNHIVSAGSISRAIALARAKCPHTLKVEVEAETLAQVKEAVEAGADIIMLDNMPVDMMADAVRIIDGRALTEASGNMGERDLKTVAETGVDYISIGALTHSVKAMDISLRFK